jgi:multimeric flavodoxin WrbA
MKTILINASPRKNHTTALLVKEAQKGAMAAGAQTEYIDLYDMVFTGCRSCLVCKMEGMHRCRCYWKDDASSLIDNILAADCVIFGSPIYLGEPTAQFRALYERLMFCVLSYDGVHKRGYYERKLNVGFIYTMNAPREYYENRLKGELRRTEHFCEMFLKGRVETCASFRTQQVDDFSKYSMGAFNEAEIRKIREEQFPLDLKEAFDMAARLSSAE